MRSRLLAATLALALLACVAPGGRAAGAIGPDNFVTVDAGHNVTRLELPGPAPDAPAAPGAPDADLEPCYPISAYNSAGTYHAGPVIHIEAVNLDADAQLELVGTSLATGPLYAWHADCTPVAGWPVSGGGAAYPATGRLSATQAGQQVFAAFWSGSMRAYAANGVLLPGWPLQASNYVASAPSLADVNGDGLDEIFTEEEDWNLHAYQADGTPLPGWPPGGSTVGGQERHTPAIADLDGDGVPEIVTASGWTSPGIYVFAYHADGTTVDGFPVAFNNGDVDTFPVIGNVDEDSQLEIVVLTRQNGYPWNNIVNILTPQGSLELSVTLSSGVPYGTAPALADLDSDGAAEIIVQTETLVYVVRGNGTAFPGWPVTIPGGSWWLGNSSPVVGDVDGDGLPDIAFTTQQAGSSTDGSVWLYSRDGVLHSHFPKALPIGSGAVPAIADIDQDGRNELVVMADYWNGYSGTYPKVWAYDLQGVGPYGPVLWGQFGGNPRHTNFYGQAELTEQGYLPLVRR